jgi:nucleoside-diphosphate-sugar epimerase
MRVLVIGGTGFIGAHIVRQIASPGHSVLPCRKKMVLSKPSEPMRSNATFLRTLEKCFEKTVFEPRDGRIL